MSMTKRDFEIIAETIATLSGIDDEQRVHVAQHFANELSEINPRFNRERFITASTTPRWIVRCEDGAIRHRRAFGDLADAERFAEWEHACTTTHTIERARQRLSERV